MLSEIGLAMLITGCAVWAAVILFTSGRVLWFITDYLRAICTRAHRSWQRLDLFLTDEPQDRLPNVLIPGRRR